MLDEGTGWLMSQWSIRELRDSSPLTASGRVAELSRWRELARFEKNNDSPGWDGGIPKKLISLATSSRDRPAGRIKRDKYIIDTLAAGAYLRARMDGGAESRGGDFIYSHPHERRG